ncbi:ComEC/Rec2 family competence protein [Ehrlichia ruminantium]|uniref:Similar to competence locus E protein 3 n=1 Tax=Ehrlichia ruminantium (strain Welgevonden) TaxID=254945 RepID=A0A0H3M6D7_EHRRW|nr:ComEC/Rec2 family competence protein [Ehrlichia ruminantium]CAI27106.1 Similar to competence locus E protein 3 [Ehrlichia ruminantium str. Welgevonden]KYW96166.1 competence protein [Ehrlichia ruminantium]QLK50661.1 ComEC/Rec2 family competence protein [Ehrlichia ruminantium]QLK51586.1 ComEC/Rec2 family competence protein [Ehrlichia ruminantium]QLK53422.1 ComEC/Rec2 family competence protein [Ehrlichia ruminantium]
MDVIITNFISFLHKQLENNKNSLMLWIPVLQGIGVIIYFSLPTEPQSYIVLCIVFTLFVSLIAVILKKSNCLFLSLFFILFGFVTIYVKAHYFSGDVLQAKIYAKDIIGTVKEVSSKQSHKRVIICDVQNVKYNVTCIRLVSRTQWDENIEIGDRILLSAIVYPPQTAVSPFSYDFSRVSYFKKINGIGFTISNVRLFEKRKSKKIFEYIELIRLHIYKLFLRNLTWDTANVVSALVIGKKDGISNDIMGNIRNAGIAHLFAISGLHLSFITGLFFSLSRNLLVFFGNLAESYNIKKISAVIAIIVSLIYLLLTGMSVSAERAFLMTSYVFIGILIDRRHNNFRAIAIAAFIILLCYPEAVLNPSFQMSFAAVLALIASCDIFTKLIIIGDILQYFSSIVLSSLIAGLATLPYVIYHFHNFSIIGVFVNVLAIPVTTFFIIPLSLLYVVLSFVNLEFYISYALESSVKLLLYVSSYVSKIDSLILSFHAVSSVSILIITLGFLFLCLWNGSLRFLGLVVIVCGLFIGFQYVTPDILVNINNIAVKESDGQLYSVNKNAHITGFIGLVWAKQNGQQKLLKYNLENAKCLFCEAGKGCIYTKQKRKILIAYTSEYVIQNCLDIDLVIQFGKFVYPQECHKQYLSYVDIISHGPYFIWVLDNKVKISKHNNRIWNV